VPQPRLLSHYQNRRLARARTRDYLEYIAATDVLPSAGADLALLRTTGRCRVR
jgi:hypothetical protein